SDVYSAGMVLYEALAGREWPIVEAPERANWSGVPGAMRPVLQKALAWAPSDRWIDGCEFRDALLGAFDRAGRLRVRRVKRVAGVIVAGGLVVLTWIRSEERRVGKEGKSRWEVTEEEQNDESVSTWVSKDARG